MSNVVIQFLPFLGFLGYAVAFLLAYTGTKWWKAAVVGALLNLIIGFATSFLTDIEGAMLLFLFSGPVFIIAFPIAFIINAIFAGIGSFVRKWRR